MNPLNILNIEQFQRKFIMSTTYHPLVDVEISPHKNGTKLRF